MTFLSRVINPAQFTRYGTLTILFGHLLGRQRDVGGKVVKSEKLSLGDVQKQILEECRMVLPGIQALFGFQLIAVFNQGFADLSRFDRDVHMVALLLNILAIGCVVAPASFHRQVERDCVSEQLINFSSKLLCVGMMPLLASLSLDTYVVAKAISEHTIVGVIAASFAACYLTFLWYVIPQNAKRKRHCQESDERQNFSIEFEKTAV